MIWWAVVAGALIGWSGSYYGGLGLVLGGMLGAMMGAWLQAALRTEMERTVDRRLAGFELRPAAPDDADEHQLSEPVSQAIPATRDRQDVEPEPEREPEAITAPEPAVRPEPALAAQASEAPSTSQYVHEPSSAELLIERARDWLLGGNTIVRAGLVVLFIGLVFLARLVVNAGLFPIEARLATVGAAGAALLGVGYWKRIARPDFGLHLQGAGVAVMYLTVFAAARIYGVMPPGVDFGFMILFAALGATLAVLQNSLTMAMASFLGGFAVPFLLGGDAETPTALFTYFTVLNLAIMGIAWKKSWRPLNLLGFVATFLMAGVWGFGAYEERHFLICEIFLALSIAIYLATALLYAHNTPGKLGNFADSTLLFDTAIAGFGLQAGLVHDKPYWAAWSAVAFGAVYLAVATWTFRRRDQGMGLLSECLLAIGVGFVTMAIPLALEVEWVGVAWLLEGAGALWVGARQERWMPRAFGLLLQVAGAVMVLSNLGYFASALPLANPGFLQPFVGAVALLFTAWVLRGQLSHSGSSWAKAWEPIERGLAAPWFLGAFGMAVIAIEQELRRALPATTPDAFGDQAYSPAFAMFSSLIAVLALMALADWFGRKVQWKVASWPTRTSLLLIGFSFLQSLALSRYVVQLPDLPIWIAAFSLHFWMLRRADQDPATAAPRWNGFIHAMGVLGLTVMLANALFYGVDQAELWDSSWAGVVFLVAGVAILMGITRWAGPASVGTAGLTMGWPHNVHSRAYWWRAAAPLAVVLYFGALIGTLLAQGITDPLPYIPLLNPVDLSIALVLAALALWRQMLQSAVPVPRGAGPFAGRFGLGAGAVLAFVWINTIWTRTADHFLGATWYPTSNDNSQVVLTGFSILWTLMAMGLMLFGQRKAQRLPWLTGAVLLAVVVAKLIFVDMSAVEGFARIASFIGVGVLMLLIGYFVPLPPRKGDEEDKP